MSAVRQFFGTDGVRGPYGGPVVNEAFFARLGAAAGAWAKETADKNKMADGSHTPNLIKARNVAIIGRDTRASGESLARAVAMGLLAAGLEPVPLGVTPTPGVVRGIKGSGNLLGVVITASHNPASDNGIKFFKGDGSKLSDEEEARIEALLPADVPVISTWAERKIARMSSVRYVLAEEDDSVIVSRGKAFLHRFLLSWLSRETPAVQIPLPPKPLHGWRIVLDTANGATCETSPQELRRVGAEVIGIGNTPDGANINDNCGSEHPEKMCAAVREHGARLGIAHDGDGDRCVLCDEQGEVLDGDEILTILALHALREGRLGVDTLVVTVQSNLGVDAAVAAAGGRVVRTPVGDRHVAEKMRELGATLGGESSGHIICADVSPTGDGLVAALRVMEVMRATGRPLSELRRWLKKFPQASTTVTVATGAAKPSLDTLPTLTTAIRALEAEMGARGRVLARWSGTEPKLRLLVEGPDDIVVRDGLARLAAAARTDLGAGAA
jgi:phosphoglucosamine mutase